MKFTLSALKKHLTTEHSAAELAAAMVALGLEVEEIADEAAAFHRVVVGNIIKRVQHPDADKLGVCTVDVGEKEPRTIVCGAPNARDHITVAVALDGACLPGDFKIKPTKMRGVTSNGMICSVRELNLGDEHDGIWELDTDQPAGTPLADVLETDVVFDVSITPNRGDALSVYGIARDLAAANMGTLLPFGTGRDTIETTAATDVIVADSLKDTACPFFTVQRLTGVTNGPSPSWLKQELTRIGLRPINTLADLTNWLLNVYGQPMHVYDADKVQGTLRVQPAKGGEILNGLDGNSHTLAAGDMAICDTSGMIGLAGIVGGTSTAVDENTTNILIEVAQFDADHIAATGQRLGCHTDARHRFERGTDPAITVPVAATAAAWMQKLCGGETHGLQTTGRELPNARVIAFDPERVKTFGGLSIATAEIKEILTRLGFTVADDTVPWQVTAPSWATIMDSDADVVEEVIRVKGLDHIPAVLPAPAVHKITGADQGRRVDHIARRALAAAGFLECINYSFTSKADAALFADSDVLLEIDNPLDTETMSTLRTSLLPSLLRAAEQNKARSQHHIRLAEVGKVYTKTTEKRMAAAVLMGAPAKNWQGKAAGYDVFDIKAHAENLLIALGLPKANLQVRTGQARTGAGAHYHPGRSGVMALGKTVFARFGEVHPALVQQMDLKERAVVFEVDLDACDQLTIKPKRFTMSAYQPVTRDVALLVDSTIAAGDLIAAVKGADKTLVSHVNLFDVYTGDGVPAGKKSVALTMTLQAPDRTLNEADITAVYDKAVANVAKRYGAEVR